MVLHAEIGNEEAVELGTLHFPPEPRLPPSLAFLKREMDADLLQSAAQAARKAGVPADIVLLNEGHCSANRYYRCLAAHLGLPFAERPLRPSSAGDLRRAMAVGVVPLLDNPHGLRFLAAPRGHELASFLDLVSSRGTATLPRLALTTPDRLDALVRHAERRAVLRHASHGLPDWNARLSARDGLSGLQAGSCAGLAAAVCVSAWLDPALCVLVIHLVFVAAFALLVGLRLLATAASPPSTSQPDSPRAADCDLPIYSVVVPLFRETRVVRRLVAALDRLDYPRAKLDIMLMVEANDPATLDALAALDLPGCYRAIVAPRGRPQTKPRALNYALQFARGSFLVVYDAEDDPEPAQLRDAITCFSQRPKVACLQARLAIDNGGDTWLTRLFAIEYATLFDVINPGLARLGLPVPLGGTSNHFRIDVLRHLNGWDAWNVTEDIDLGIRLARFGFTVETLASTTHEEAPNTLKAWLAQRRRWLKGWIVTLGTHSRDPGRLLLEIGPGSFAAVGAMLFGTVGSCLLGPFCLLAFLVRLWSGDVLHPQTASDAVWSAVGCSLMAAGVASAIWPALLGLHRRRWWALSGWLPLLPAYLVLLSLAAWGAAYEVAGRPYSWSKTEHGRAKRRIAPGAGS